MVQRWWLELKELRESINVYGEPGSPVRPAYTGNNTRISGDAVFSGSVIIGDNCMIGTGAVIRGNVIIGNNVKVGYGVEIKDSVIKDDTTIGPLCYIGDSLIEKGVYMGALVRTSNHRLDRETVKSWNGEAFEETGHEKLGAWVKENASLGIGVVILPGRIVPENSIFEPHIVITKNYVPGHYRAQQNIVKIG